MDEAITVLDLEFKRLCHDLEKIRYKLEADLRAREDLPNIVSMIRRLHGVEHRITAAKKKSDDFIIERQKAVLNLTDVMMSSTANLQSLTQARSISLDEDLKCDFEEKVKDLNFAIEICDITKSWYKTNESQALITSKLSINSTSEYNIL